MPSTKYFAIRLDIDTVACARAIPAMLQLAKQHQFKITFYVNLGRSISYKAALERRISQTTKDRKNSAKKFSIHSKLGTCGLLETLLFNPKLSTLCIDALHKAKEEGHEVGLHGGTNHSVWHTYAPAMSKKELSKLLAPALEQFNHLFPGRFGFTSPGFATNDFAYSLLKEAGCAYISDSTTISEMTNLYNLTSLFPNIPVTLYGPDNVDFLENYMASKNATPLSHYVKNNFNNKRFSIYYSHPCFITHCAQEKFIELVKIYKQFAISKTVAEILTFSHL